jgi:hypothetical protein
VDGQKLVLVMLVMAGGYQSAKSCLSEDPEHNQIFSHRGKDDRHFLRGENSGAVLRDTFGKQGTAL